MIGTMYITDRPYVRPYCYCVTRDTK